MLRAVPGVGEVAVIGLPDPRWGQSVCAVIVPDGVPPDGAELIGACRARLAGFKAPRRIEFVDGLPRTGTGKIRKSALRAQLSEARPTWGNVRNAAHGAGPALSVRLP